MRTAVRTYSPTNRIVKRANIISKLISVNKVITYITRGEQLLIFDQPGAKHAGFQVPAGTLEPGEDPAAGALREAMEETGLKKLSIVGPLGKAERDMRDFSVQQIHHRHFFHLICEQATPDTWQHTDPDPSLVSEDMPLLPFDFQWVRMPDDVPHLIADFGYHLPSLYQTLGIKDST